MVAPVRGEGDRGALPKGAREVRRGRQLSTVPGGGGGVQAESEYAQQVHIKR